MILRSTVRLDAPDELRGIIVDLAYESGLTPDVMRSLVCQVLRTREDRTTGRRIRTLMTGSVGASIRASGTRFTTSWRPSTNDSRTRVPGNAMEKTITTLRPRSISISDGEALAGNSSMGSWKHGVPKDPRHTLSEARRGWRIPVGSGDERIHQAISDLSRRPRPDITGAIQHALAALKCVARDAAGTGKQRWAPSFLGTLAWSRLRSIRRLRSWGSTSEQGRHLREERSQARKKRITLSPYLLFLVDAFVNTPKKRLKHTRVSPAHLAPG